MVHEMTESSAGRAGSNELERMAALLESCDEYRVLRRLRPLPRLDPLRFDSSIRQATFIDVETTGLDPASEEIVELAMVNFGYSTEGRIIGIGDSFEALRDPGRPIPPGVISLTGITDDMVAGRKIEPVDVARFAAPAALVVAHNAEFDRRFCERFCPSFVQKPWACSLRDISWNEEGFVNGARLGNLAAAFGMFYDGHRAMHDCHAGIVILSQTLRRSGRTAMSALLQSARTPRWRVWAPGAPFALRGMLKARGYRWNNGGNGHPRAWFVEVKEEELAAETIFLRSHVCQSHDTVIDARRVTAFDRYSVRC